MPLPIEILEAFFGNRLQTEGTSSGLQSLTHFDGFIHWHVLWLPGESLIKIAADREARITALPIVEIEGFYCGISTLQLTGGATALVLKPVGARDSRNYVVITKDKDGRFSMSTTCGNPLQTKN
jgi:hypothetical protein